VTHPDATTAPQTLDENTKQKMRLLAQMDPNNYCRVLELIDRKCDKVVANIKGELVDMKAAHDHLKRLHTVQSTYVTELMEKLCDDIQQCEQLITGFTLTGSTTFTKS
jgi:hypothetical protein